MTPQTTKLQVNPSEEIIRLGPLAVCFLLTGDNSNGSIAVFELIVPSAERLAAPAHSHDHYEETIYGVSGVLTWTVDGTQIDVGPGQALCIPRGAIHRFDNNGIQEAKSLCVITPAAIGPQYFRESAEVISAAAGGPPDRAKMSEIMRRHGLTPGPPPSPENRRDADMSAVSAPQRIELSPAVRALLKVNTPKSRLLRHFLCFLEAILAADPAGIDKVVTPDARFHELEAIGYPRGPEGFKIFRRQVNAAVPDEHIFVSAVRFEGDDIIEADLNMSATHTGEEFMGRPAMGRKIRFDVHARSRFVDGKMAERWDRADFEDIKRQLV
jgi:quercetin dioxygenase-like cupin family protein/predicted ester cyclase